MIANIRLQNFRSYQDASFEFASGVNVIVGPNASGKTNLLEAILLIAQGSSYRAKDGELVRFDEPWARLEADEGGSHRVVKLEQPADGSRVKKTFVIDDQNYSRLSLAKSLPVVLFEPNYLLLLTGSPELRRGFLDELLSQTTVGYKTTLSQYRRALAQRNALLKKGPQQASSQLFAWDIRLSELGDQIVEQRLKVIERFNKDIGAVYSDLAHHTSEVKLTYQSSCEVGNYATSLLKKLAAGSELDFLRGFTAYGPHRDDLVIELNGHAVQASASRGETRTFLLALKTLELQLVEESRSVPPILLLDDVFSELDGARRRALTQLITNYQTFITTTDADVIGHDFMSLATTVLLG